MKRTLLTFLLVTFLVSTKAQIPDGYYSTADGKTGATLKTALYNILKVQNPVTYSEVWSAFYTTDKKPNGKVWDMYSDIPGGTPPYEYTFVSDQCGNSSTAKAIATTANTPGLKAGLMMLAPMSFGSFSYCPTDGYVNGQTE